MSSVGIEPVNLQPVAAIFFTFQRRDGYFIYLE